MQSTELYQNSFSGLERIYGRGALNALAGMNVAVVGIGGVGSWAAESLARSAVGNITLIDLDNISLSNINRQLPATTESVGMAKVNVMQQRILSINPSCRVSVVEDFIQADNVEKLIHSDFHYVIDCIDAVNEKAALAAHCRRNKIKLVITGGAGGKTDLTQLRIADLGKTFHDPLLARLRQKLKDNYSLSPSSKGKYALPCVFSSQQSIYPAEDGSVRQEKPKSSSVSGLNCHHGMGSLMAMTAAIGLTASSVALNKYMEMQHDK